nr:hypothetical protein [Rhizobium rhizogenes]
MESAGFVVDEQCDLEMIERTMADELTRARCASTYRRMHLRNATMTSPSAMTTPFLCELKMLA